MVVGGLDSIWVEINSTKKFQLTVNVGRLGTFFIIINLDFMEFIVRSNNYYKNSIMFDIIDQRLLK